MLTFSPQDWLEKLLKLLKYPQSKVCEPLVLRVNPISLSYPFPFVLPLALDPRNQVVNARGENTWLLLRHHTSSLAGCYVTRGDQC